MPLLSSTLHSPAFVFVFFCPKDGAPGKIDGKKYVYMCVWVWMSTLCAVGGIRAVFFVPFVNKQPYTWRSDYASGLHDLFAWYIPSSSWQ